MKLGEIGGGALEERFEMGMDALMENVMDPNTDPTAVRTLTLTVKFKPDDGRTMAGFSYGVKTSLAPIKTIASIAMIDRDPDTGKPVAREISKDKARQIPGQQSIEDMNDSTADDKVVPMKRKE